MTLPHTLIRFAALLSLCFLPWASAEEDTKQKSEKEELPIVTHEGLPYISVIITDEDAKWSNENVTHRERLLSEAFNRALQRTKLQYAYSLNFSELPRQQWVPQLNIKMTAWRFQRSGVAECILDANFYDAAAARHDLKGAIGYESTDGMTDDRYSRERYLQLAAQDAFESVLNAIRKNGLYRN